jgi:hypothetical protein
MRDAELRRYVDRLVELRFTDGQIVVGTLERAGARVAVDHQYVIKLSRQAASTGLGRTWLAIADASLVESVRLSDLLPEMTI